MPSPLPRCGQWVLHLLSSPLISASRKGCSGRPAHCLFRGLLSVHSRYGLHTRAATLYRGPHSEGFNCFVTSTVAPVASGWSIFAGRGSHPLESAAFPRRTPVSDIDPAPKQTSK